MGIFRRKPSNLAPPAARVGEPTAVDALQFSWNAKADPANIDNVKAEWNMNNSDYHDPRAWGNGMRLFETGPPGQRFNAAEYMSRGFCNVLFHPNFMNDDDVEVTIERMLAVFDAAKISSNIEAEIAAQRIRLALAVMRERAWQPTTLGGTGRMNLDLDSPRIRASLASAAIPPDRSLEHFFGLL